MNVLQVHLFHLPTDSTNELNWLQAISLVSGGSRRVSRLRVVWGTRASSYLNLMYLMSHVHFIIILFLVLLLHHPWTQPHPDQVQWTPATQDIWGPSLTSLQGMLVKVSFTRYLKTTWNLRLAISTEVNQSLKCHAHLMLSTKVESHEFKPFKDAAEDYANKYSIIQLHSKLKQVLHKHLHGKSHFQAPSASSEQQHWMPRGDKTEGKGGNQSHRCAPGIIVAKLIWDYFYQHTSIALSILEENSKIIYRSR